jgi:hypothetical protein
MFMQKITPIIINIGNSLFQRAFDLPGASICTYRLYLTRSSVEREYRREIMLIELAVYIKNKAAR